MFRLARVAAIVLILLPALPRVIRAESAADLLDPVPTPKPALPLTPVTASHDAQKSLGSIDEPGFKASAKFKTAPPLPDYDPVAGSAGTITVPKRNAWSVPKEDGAPSAPNAAGQTAAGGAESAHSGDDKNAKSVELISPALAGAIAREKSGAPLAEMLPLYRAISTSEPASASAHYRYGLTLLRLKETQKGLVEFEAAIALEPKNTKYLCDYGISALKAGWVEKAYAACSAVVQIAPNNPRYLTALADVHAAAGHAPEALETYARALKEDPQNANIYYNLGLVYMHARSYKQAADTFGEALRLKPNTSMYLCSRGLAFENSKNFKMALLDYKAAIKADDKNAYAHYLYAGIFSDPEDPTYTNRFEAFEHAEKAVKLTDRKNAQYLMGLARALRLGRNYEQAADIAKKAVELEPGRVDFRQEWQRYERMKKEGTD